MEALNHYFHDQKSGEYWRPFGHKKSPRNIRQNDKTVVGNKHRHTGLCYITKYIISVLFICNICIYIYILYVLYNIYIYLIYCIFYFTHTILK